MNEYVLTAAVIIAILSIGLGFLLRFGVTEVVYFGVFIIIATIIGSLGYTWWKTQTDKTVDRLRNELLLKIKRDIRDTQKCVLEAAELVDQEPVLADIEGIKRNLINLRLYDEDFRITQEAKKYTLTLIEQENRRTEQRLRGLENMAAVNYRPKLEEYIQNFDSKLEELEATGYGIQKQREAFGTLAAQEAVSLRDMLEKKKRITRAYAEILEACADEAQELLTLSEKYGSVKKIAGIVSKARKNLSDFDTAVKLLIDARNQLKNFLKDFFAIEYNQLSSSLKTLSPLLKNEYISEERRKAIEGIIEKALEMRDPGLLGELQKLKNSYKKEVSSLVEELHRKHRALEREIKERSPPSDIWRSDDIAEHLVRRLNVETELRVFSRHAAEAIEHLTTRLREDDAFLRILQNYDRVEPLITMKLNQGGKLAATDLNVKYPEKFLIIYSKRHPDTIYRQTTSTLVKI
jgi:hypothetical protein